MGSLADIFKPDPPPTREELAEVDPEMLFADGLDAALIGYAERFGQPPLAMYDREKCIAILSARGMSYDEAVEFFEYNTLGAWCGEYTPVFVTLWNPGQIGRHAER